MDVSNPQSFNRYAYVGNNPLNAIDPSGTHVVDCVWDGCGGHPGGGGGGGGGGGAGQIVDGVPQTLQTGSLGGNSLAACPNDFCAGWVGKSNGGASYLQYSADANGQGQYATLATAPPPPTVADKVYAAYQLAYMNGNNAEITQAIIARLVGFTYNVQILGDSFNWAAAIFGVADPRWANSANHPGANGSYYFSNSIFGLAGMNVQHVADLTKGIEAHYDTFGPYNPLHWFGEWLPSLVINRRNAAVPGSSTYSNWTCTIGVGCTQ